MSELPDVVAALIAAYTDGNAALATASPKLLARNIITLVMLLKNN